MTSMSQNQIAAAAERVAPSTVRVRGQAGRHRGPRTVGVVVAQDRVLTNAHGVHRDATVSVRFDDGTTTGGEVIARDLDGDLAVLEVPTGDRPAVVWADDAPGLGEPVLTVVPTRHGPRVTTGHVSGTGRRFRGPNGRPIEDGVEHTAPLARGSSGSPLLDAEGRLIGVNTHRTEPFYLAVPVSPRLRERTESLARGEAPTPRRLGIAVAPPHVAARLRSAVGLQERDGVLVRGVDDDGPAAAAGVEGGDLIVAVAGVEVSDPDDLFATLADAPATITLTLVRGEGEREVEVTFGGE